MFKLDKLRIYDNCLHRKNLKADMYVFGSEEADDFYGANLSLQVIVGKNGSGKSSLLDMILRLANNLGALLFKDEARNASADLNYVLGLYADLYYQIALPNGQTRICLCCRDRALWLEVGDYVQWISDEKILGCQPSHHPAFAECIKRAGSAEKIHFDILTPGKQQEIANLFFYTVATNYSMLGFLSPDYDDEKSLWYTFVVDRDENGKELHNADGNPRGKYKWVESHNWVNSLFHKNDGYMCPIVLNPYRNDAKIDMANETNLSVQRLTAMFICEEKDKPLVPGYKLDGLIYEYKENFMHDFKQARGGKSEKELIADFLDCAATDGYYAKRILEGLQVEIKKDQHEYLNILAMYMVQKVLNIADTYPLYIEKYGAIGGIDRTFLMFEKDSHCIVAGELAEHVRTHNSHIELKVQQAIGFYKWAQEHTDDYQTLLENFNYSTYKELRQLPEYTNDKLAGCMQTLPPAIFKQQIYLQRKGEDGLWLSGIPIWRMSSGERQLIYQMSTIVYHLHNLSSVNQGALRYHNLNIVLDEIEICYHPDYQRKFVKSLIDLLKGQGMNLQFNIHILITTHSPFVLSDVISSHILYLQNGRQLKDGELKNIRNPFAANVNDILKQSFFMEEGFVGSLSAERINSLVDFLTGEPEAKSWTDKEMDLLLSNIGDPLVVFQLKKLIAEYKTRSGVSYREWLQSELSKLT